MIKDPKIQKEIIRLYFDEMYTFNMLLKHFKHQFTYAELKTFITNYIKEA